MRKIKIEYTAFDYKDFTPNNLFFKELSSQITPKITELVADNVMRENLPDLICLSVNPDSYLSSSYQDGINSMRMDISSRSAPLIICEVAILWCVTSKCKINPWDDLQGDTIHFDLLIKSAEIKALNAMLPRLFHPVIKSKESGLPYDYQIYYGGEALLINTYKPISQHNIEVIREAFGDFYDKWSSSHRFNIDSYKIQTPNKTLIKILVDVNEWDTETVEAMIRCFSGIDIIKRIVFR